MVLYSKVSIDSTTIKDDSGSDPKLVYRWEYTKNDDDQIDDLFIYSPRTLFDTVEVNPGQTVEVYISHDNVTYSRRFYGYVDKVIPRGAYYEIVCKNELMTLIRTDINKVYDSNIDASAGEISEIAKDIIETYAGMTANVQDSGTSQILEEFKCLNTDCYERIQALKDSLLWILWYDDVAREVHFEPRGYVDSGVTLTTSDNIVGVPEWDFDTSQMVNDLRVDGAAIQTTITETGTIGTTSGWTTSDILLSKTPDSTELILDGTQREGGSKDASSTNYYWTDRENKKLVATSSFTNGHAGTVNYLWSSPAPIHMINQSSINTYGVYQKTIQLSDITSVADAESRAATILSRRSLPLISANLLIKSNIELEVGQTVSIVDNITKENVDGEYVIHSITYKYPSGATEIRVGDKEWRLADWQSTTDDRLKRLEEQFIRNQDILLELRSIVNTSLTNFKKMQNRYVQMLTRNITGDFILSNPGFATLDVQTLGGGGTTEQLSYCKQYNNIYTENFVDTDFEGSSTTANWDTSNNEVSFTSGQIAESETVDMNNGLITNVSVYLDIDSGQFDLEATADGVNWETIDTDITSSGTYTHNFSNQGYNLKWRITESNSSTGTISQVKLSNYH